MDVRVGQELSRSSNLRHQTPGTLLATETEVIASLLADRVTNQGKRRVGRQRGQQAGDLAGDRGTATGYVTAGSAAPLVFHPSISQIPPHPRDRENQHAHQGEAPWLPATPRAGRREHAQHKPYGHQPGHGIYGGHAFSMRAQPHGKRDRL